MVMPGIEKSSSHYLKRAGPFFVMTPEKFHKKTKEDMQATNQSGRLHRLLPFDDF